MYDSQKDREIDEDLLNLGYRECIELEEAPLPYRIQKLESIIEDLKAEKKELIEKYSKLSQKYSDAADLIIELRKTNV